MEKIIILSFVVLAYVCIIQAGTPDPSATAAPSSPPSPAPTNATTPKAPSNATTPTDESTTAAEGSKAPTSGAVSVRGFAGLVMSVLLIALF